jgi:hypothetical protein
MRWAILLVIALAAGCGDDPDVYSLDGGAGTGGGAQDAGGDGD